MKKVVNILGLVFLLLTSGTVSAWAEVKLPTKLEQLSEATYRYYSLRETDLYFETTKKLKDATEFSQYQETYYRVCSYEAIYMFEYVDRTKGATMAHNIYRHAKKDNSNIGLYFATFALGSIRQMSGNIDMAEKNFQLALELREKYLPDRSAAPCYLGLCEVALRRKDYDAVQKYARQALDEPGVLPMNQITAWSYKCIVRYNQGDSAGFEDAYKERAALVAEYGGQGGTFGELVNVYQARNRKQWDLALKRTNKLVHKQNRCIQRASIYEEMGNLEMALYWQKKTREVMDSVLSSESRLQMNEFDTELSLDHAESETRKQEMANSRLMMTAYAVIAAITIAFLAFFAYRRNKHLRHLQSVNKELQEAYGQLEETTKAKERIESELRIARDIQRRMLPSVFPRRKDVDLYAMMTPAREVGGDLYGYALLDDMLYFCVGDVSGKGVPAALFMAEVTRMFRTLVEGRLSPDNIATRLNNALSEDNDQGMFVTMFIGLIHLKSGHMDFCNAGHNPPLLDGQYMHVESNAPIGLWQEADYAGGEVDNMHGRTLFVYTDGINEAENANQEQFGTERLQALLQKDLGDARQTSEIIHKAVQEFVGNAEPSDDLTKMCIKVK